MPTFGDKPATKQDQSFPHPTGPQVFFAGVAVAAIVLASRGKIEPSKAEKIVRFSTKSVLGIGVLGFGAGVPGHGPNGQPVTPTLAELRAELNFRESPSGKYVYVVDPRTKERTRVTVEDLAVLQEAGLVRKAGKGKKKVGEVEMSELWNADP